MVDQIRLGAALLALLVAAPAQAQDASESADVEERADIAPDRLERLTRGERAPSDGFLVSADLLLDWSFRIRRLRRLRILDAEAAEQRCAVQVGHADRRVQIEVERGEELRNLWRERAQGLAEELRAERGFDLLESPFFWFAAGVVVAVAAAVALGLAFDSS
jgi:hypothetical protein